MLLTPVPEAASGRLRSARTIVIAVVAAAVLGWTLWFVATGGTPAADEFHGGYRPHSVGGCALALGLAIGGLSFFGTIPLAGYVAFSAGVFMVMAACAP